jgi:hypothetical protein
VIHQISAVVLATPVRPSFQARTVKQRRLLFVTTGLDPVVHAEVQRRKPSGLNQLRCRMDCRIKSGNDEGREHERNERKKGKRNADRRSVSCPARKRRAGRATERRLAPPFRLRARSPVDVPPRFLRQRPNATAQLQFTRFLGQNSIGPGVTHSLPSQCSGLPRGPVIVPAGHFGPEPPGSGGDEAPPAGTVLAPAVRHHRTGSLESEIDSLRNVTEKRTFIKS